MLSLNKVTLIGNLTRDPELQHVPSGAAVVNLGLAVNYRYTNGQGEPKEETTFLTVVVWQKQAEAIAQYLKKGAPVLVEGRLQSQSWETKDGDKRMIVKVAAERVQWLGRKPQGEASPQTGAPAPAPADDDGVPF